VYFFYFRYPVTFKFWLEEKHEIYRLVKYTAVIKNSLNFVIFIFFL